MTIMLSTSRLTPRRFESSVKFVLTLSMVAALSACETIRYNGISNANTVFDIFSFTDDEAQTEQSLAEAEQAKKAEEQRALALQQQEAKLAEQPGADTYQRLAEGEVLAEAAVSQEPSATGKEPSAFNNQPGANVQSNAQETVQTRTEAAREVAQHAMNSAQPESAQSMQMAAGQVAAEGMDQQADVMQQTTVLVSTSASPAQEMKDVSDVQQVQETDVAAVENINRMTEENPTAAMVSDYQVLPEVSAKAELSVPNEILLLATPAEYRPEVSEYGMWKIAKGDDSLYRENCTLASATMQVSFDNYSTQVWLSVVGDDLLVNSTTNIDINRPKVGIKLDNGDLQPFTKKHFATNAVWAGDLNTALKRNKKLSVILSGNEIGNRIQEVSVELDDLRRAYKEYSKCNATTQVGSL